MIYPCPMFDAKATIIENAVGSLPNVRCQDCKLLPWAVIREECGVSARWLRTVRLEFSPRSFIVTAVRCEPMKFMSASHVRSRHCDPSVIPASAMSTAGQKGISYRTSCTGKALETVNSHQDDAEIVMFGANFCPFVQRVWATLEYKKIPYRYVECDPYKKPKELLDLNPKGLVPALKLPNGRSLAESTVIMEYLEEAYSPPNAPEGQHALILPPLSDPYGRARARLEADKINRALVPAFYRFLQAQETAKQIQFGKEFLDELENFAKAMDLEGPFFSGKELGFVDIMIAPWAFRVTNVLKHYRGFELPPTKGRYQKWADAVFSHPAFVATCSTEDLYIDSYARYAENRPGTSQVADAINSGRGLP